VEGYEVNWKINTKLRIKYRFRYLISIFPGSREARFYDNKHNTNWKHYFINTAKCTYVQKEEIVHIRWTISSLFGFNRPFLAMFFTVEFECFLSYALHQLTSNRMIKKYTL
jgi:hypothetical protein